MERILITGGAGFIGSHTCINLLENNYEVYLVDSFVNSSPVVINRLLSICDLKNSKLGKTSRYLKEI